MAMAVWTEALSRTSHGPMPLSDSVERNWNMTCLSLFSWNLCNDWSWLESIIYISPTHPPAILVSPCKYETRNPGMSWSSVIQFGWWANIYRTGALLNQEIQDATIQSLVCTWLHTDFGKLGLRECNTILIVQFLSMQCHLESNLESLVAYLL